MTANVLSPVIRQPTTDRHDCIGGVAARSKVSSTTCMHGLTGRVMREIKGKFLKEPSMCRDQAVLTQPQFCAMREKGVT